MTVDAKSNEITALPKLLAMLTLRGKVVTADAMHCQRQAAQQVIEQYCDYALALKGNQGTLRDDVQLLLDDPAAPLAQNIQISKGHGRIETRIASVSSDAGWLQEAHKWPSLDVVGKVTAIRQQDGAVSEQCSYCLLSATFTVEQFNAIVRSRWGIENRLHWALDATCREDRARSRKGHCAESLELLRKLALNLARLGSGKGTMGGKLKRAGWDDSFLISIWPNSSKSICDSPGAKVAFRLDRVVKLSVIPACAGI